jgi:hypothetical protein
VSDAKKGAKAHSPKDQEEEDEVAEVASGKASKTKEEEAAAGEEEEEEEEAAEEEEEEAESKGEKKDVKVRKSANDQIQTKAPMKDKEAKDAIAEFMER